MERLTELYSGVYREYYKYGNQRHNRYNKVIEKLGELEDLEEKIFPLTLERLVNITLDETRMPLDALFKQYQLYQQAFYLACWGLAEYDDKGWCDEMEASDEWKEIIMKEAEKKLEEIINGKNDL